MSSHDSALPSTTLHADAARVLAAWAAPDPGQGALRDAYLEHLATYADAMSRTRQEGHLTASAVVVDPAEGRVLLTLHPKVGLWLQTGGHCEDGDGALAEAALREAVEESGIAGLRLLPEPVRLDRHDVRCGGPDQWSVHFDVQYAAIAPPGSVAAISDESLDLRWFPIDALPDPTDDSVRRLVADAAKLTG
ncbi:NUDIX hydrolase [Yinghuangia seranimata]|uniref:NUDIX hydrolase n=1 Tax=Yinghuangia seranimata TaxID=408067 RepID=UPI00248CF02B|nr:NUDIX domain-containing protein [Yinghuangia seranimata]MDI2128029.1 NUDIX domain-containing protein [Yinghuangia seranimata]